jgi:hypothetical protein
MRTLESIGYAYSADGYHFTKCPVNPVAPREANPNAAAFSEVHAILEPPLVFLYHTLRYNEPRNPADKKKFPVVEDLGVQVLVTSPHFRLDVPLVKLERLGPKTGTTLEDARPLNLSHIARATLLVEGHYSSTATRGLRLNLRRSADAVRWNAVDRRRLETEYRRGEVARQNIPLDIRLPFIKVVVENMDPSESVSKVTITAELEDANI